MTLYNATPSAVIGNTETPVTSISFSEALGRARLLSWDVSFDGLIAGNNMTVSLYLTDSLVSASEFIYVPPMDGENKFGDVSPYWASQPTSVPSVAKQLDLVHLPDSSFYRRQYARGREPIFEGNLSTGDMLVVTVTPSDLLTPVRCKMNLTFSL